MIFTTVYTPEYAGIVDRLVHSCLQHNLTIFAEAVPSRGSWEQNALLKLDHLVRCFQRFRHSHLIFLDADAEIVNDPTLKLNEILSGRDFDIAMAWNGMPEAMGRVKHPVEDVFGRWHAGTILMPFAGAREKIVRDAKALIAHEGTTPPAPEEYAICKTLVDDPKFRCFDLPHELCQVYDKPHDINKTFILQHQASRQMRKKVGADP